MLDRNEIISKAIDDCMREMYAKSQPVGDFDQLVQDVKDGKIDKNERIYERYYLSKDEFDYILQKYKDAYRFNEEWSSNIELLEKYLREGGTKDKYIAGETDESGFTRPGYRGYEKVPPLKEQILNIVSKLDCSALPTKVTEDIYNKVMETIGCCKEFYKFDRENSVFSISVALGASPTSNKETVKRWWKENKGIDIKIEERIPKLFWYYDQGYTDEDLAIEFEKLGENWKEALYKEWKDEVKAKEEEIKMRILELKEKN